MNLFENLQIMKENNESSEDILELIKSIAGYQKIRKIKNGYSLYFPKGYTDISKYGFKWVGENILGLSSYTIRVNDVTYYANWSDSTSKTGGMNLTISTKGRNDVIYY